MATIKRQKLFVNLSQLDKNNLIYDEVWIYKLVSGEEKSVGRYRIRFQKADNPMVFAGEIDLNDSEMAEIGDTMSEFGPAIVCYLEVWTSKGWIRCLDYIGDPSSNYLVACHDLNEQYKSFLVGVPISEPFISTPPPRSPWSPKKKTTTSTIKKETVADDQVDDQDDFDWI